MLLVTTGLFIKFDETQNVKADFGEGEGESSSGSISEMNSYVWERLRELCNVTRDAYNISKGDIPKGRAWATSGETYTIDNILKPALENYTEDFQKLEIGYIDDPRYRERNYSSKIVTNDARLIFYNDTSHIDVPITEFFPIAVGVPYMLGQETLDHRFDFGNVSIKNYKLEGKSEKWPLAGTYNDYFYNVSVEEMMNDYKTVVGRPLYIENNETLPEWQDGLVFIMEEDPSCEYKLDNVTGAMGCILIQNETKAGYNYPNADNLSFPLLKLNISTSNFSMVIDDLKNDSFYLVDNVYSENGTILTFTYNLDQVDYITDDFVLLKYRDSPSESGRYYDFGLLYADNVAWYTLNGFFYNHFLPECRGIILYDFEGFERIAHLEYLPLIGGDKATRDPKRLVFAIFQKYDTNKYFNKKEAEILSKLIEKSPVSSSLGRYLDALSCYLGICNKRTYSGEPAIKLEKYLDLGKDTYQLELETKKDTLLIKDLFIQIDELLKLKPSEKQKADISYCLVKKIIDGLTDIAVHKADEENIKTIGVTGGVSYNIPIVEMVEKRLKNSRLKLVVHNNVPNGDGGISIGQNAIFGYKLK